MELGRIGVWWSGSYTAHGSSESVAPELEALGFGTLWSSGGFGQGLAPHFERLLAATRHLSVASGIVNIWKATPGEIATASTGLDEAHPGRFVLGIGASHAPLVEGYEHPYGHMVEYLDALDERGPAVQRDRRVLAALGPRMLELAAERAAGAHPYFVPVEHTVRARQLLGTGPILAPEVTVLIEPDRANARERARQFTTGYLSLPNYANNLRALGYSEDDVAGGGSDRLVDAVVVHGAVETVVKGVEAHLDAGADHVALQVLATGEGFPIAQYRELAAALLLA